MIEEIKLFENQSQFSITPLDLKSINTPFSGKGINNLHILTSEMKEL